MARLPHRAARSATTSPGTSSPRARSSSPAAPARCRSCRSPLDDRVIADLFCGRHGAGRVAGRRGRSRRRGDRQPGGAARRDHRWRTGAGSDAEALALIEARRQAAVQPRRGPLAHRHRLGQRGPLQRPRALRRGPGRGRAGRRGPARARHARCGCWPTSSRPPAAGGKPERAAGPLERLTEIAEANGTDWALAFLARSRALLGEGEAAERLYREALERLAPHPHPRRRSARTLLVYGEWLRRENRRVDAREQLRAAHELLTEIGHGGLRRARPARAAGHRRDGAQAHGRDARRPDPAGAADRAAARRTGRRTRRSAPSCSSARARSSGTCARCSASSASARARSCARRCPRRAAVAGAGMKRAPPPGGARLPPQRRRRCRLSLLFERLESRDLIGKPRHRVPPSCTCRRPCRPAQRCRRPGARRNRPRTSPTNRAAARGLEGAVMQRRLGQQLGQRRGVGALHAAWQPVGDLLQHPLVAVGSGERRPVEVRLALGVEARRPLPCRIEVQDLADLDAAADQIAAGGLDVLDDQQQALLGSVIVFVPLPNWIDVGEPGGVNCTPRMPGPGSKSMSSRHPRLW